MPTKDRVGRDYRCDVSDDAATDDLTANCESAALIVCQPEPFATQLLLEDSVLSSKILDDRVLSAADPAGQGGNEDLSGLENGGHPSIVAR